MHLNNHPVSSKDYKKAKELRQRASVCEKMLWRALCENSASEKTKFRRQQPIHPYVADFACMEAKLIIELDGSSHDNRRDYDAHRDIYLRRQGYTVLRISNDEVMNNLEGIVETIFIEAQKLSLQNEKLSPVAPPLPQPLPQGEGRFYEALKDKVVSRIRTVYDPEVPVNIYDLGLIYRIGILPADEKDMFDFSIDMTLTTPNCPIADRMPDMVRRVLADLPDAHSVAVNLVWDPPWDKSRMSDEARLALNMF